MAAGSLLGAQLLKLTGRDYYRTQVLKFLDIVTEYWPKELASLGGLDQATRRNAVLQRQAESWIKSPPAHPVRAPARRRA